MILITATIILSSTSTITFCICLFHANSFVQRLSSSVGWGGWAHSPSRVWQNARQVCLALALHHHSWWLLIGAFVIKLFRAITVWWKPKQWTMSTTRFKLANYVLGKRHRTPIPLSSKWSQQHWYPFSVRMRFCSLGLLPRKNILYMLKLDFE